ncbi:MAG TPA: CDP-alcohol phosphatidyltransferase family protein [Gammaproteobacteria bacterium]|nr:CDP-alcohol phosphatidyltransferase family protein [Gammaproteobacteria bacterium]
MIEPRHIPNIITVFRLLLIPPVACAILLGSYQLAFWLFFLAGFSDGVDGFLARHYHWQSHFGATLDPIADKLLMIVSFYCLSWVGVIPWWLFTVVLFRDVIIVGGAAAYQWVTRSLQMEPILLGKLNTAVQILLVMFVLTYKAYGIIPVWSVDLLTVGLLISTIASGIAYVVIWSRKTRAHSHSES